MGFIPRVSGGQRKRFFALQELAILGREIGSRQGFGCLLIGMLLQLVGFVWGAR